MPRLPISPQKPRHENATRQAIPVAQTSDSTAFSGNITASEDVRLRGDLRKSVAGNLGPDVRLVEIRRVSNRGIGEKKQGTARDEEESTGGDEMKEQRTESLVAISLQKPPQQTTFLRFFFFIRIKYFDSILLLVITGWVVDSTQNLVCYNFLQGIKTGYFFSIKSDLLFWSQFSFL